MPIYSFRSKTTGDIADHVMSYSAKAAFKEANPDLEEVFTKAPGLGDAQRLGLIKPDGSWRDTLERVAHRGKELGIKRDTIGLR